MAVPKRDLRRATIVAVPALFKVFYKRDWESYRLLKILYSALVDAIIIKSKGRIKDSRNRYCEYQPFSYLTYNSRRMGDDWKYPITIPSQ